MTMHRERIAAKIGEISVGQKWFTGHPPYELVRRLFRYDEVVGVLIWNDRPVEDFSDNKRSAFATCTTWNKRFSGKIAGCMGVRGYRFITFCGGRWGAHRIIWLFHHGYWAIEIDHEHGVEEGDRIENLKDVTHADNMKNTKFHVDNKSGIMGVHWDKRRNKWVAAIKNNGKSICLGRFIEKDEAIEARKTAEIKYGYHINHGRKVGVSHDNAS